MFVRTEEEWQARERQLLEQNNVSLERAREAEKRLADINESLFKSSATMYKLSASLEELRRQRDEAVAEAMRLRLQIAGSGRIQPL